jgi:hypothetical protein
MTAPSPSLPARPPRRRRWVIAVLALVVFGSGAVCGAALALILTVRHVQSIIRQPERVPARITAHLNWRLGLDDAQAARVREVVERRYANVQRIRCGVYPRMQAELDAARAEIAEVLSDEQKSLWFKMFDRLRRRWRPPPPSGSPAPGQGS